MLWYLRTPPPPSQRLWLTKHGQPKNIEHDGGAAVCTPVRTAGHCCICRPGCACVEHSLTYVRPPNLPCQPVGGHRQPVGGPRFRSPEGGGVQERGSNPPPPCASQFPPAMRVLSHKMAKVCPADQWWQLGRGVVVSATGVVCLVTSPPFPPLSKHHYLVKASFFCTVSYFAYSTPPPPLGER